MPAVTGSLTAPSPAHLPTPHILGFGTCNAHDPCGGPLTRYSDCPYFAGGWSFQLVDFYDDDGQSAPCPVHRICDCPRGTVRSVRVHWAGACASDLGERLGCTPYRPLVRGPIVGAVCSDWSSLLATAGLELAANGGLQDITAGACTASFVGCDLPPRAVRWFEQGGAA